jgi:hypothetical protein
MTLPATPGYLLSKQKLDALINLLLEKEKHRKKGHVKGFGKRITHLEKAQNLLDGIIERTARILPIEPRHEPAPKLVLTHQLSTLPRQTLKSYLFVVPTAMVLVIISLQLSLKPSILVVVFSMVAFLLVIPLLVSRRTRLHLEHQCTYMRNRKGDAAIVMDELPAIQFQSYLAHEYAHHLHFSLRRCAEEPWQREGWARLVQWLVVQDLVRLTGDPAYLEHALQQIVSEMKFACEIMATALHQRLPREVRRIRTLYHSNPLFNLLTGTPGFNPAKLWHNAIGTAAYFLAVQDHTQEAILSGRPSGWS